MGACLNGECRDLDWHWFVAREPFPKISLLLVLRFVA
jgi:hypothetical protein